MVRTLVTLVVGLAVVAVGLVVAVAIVGPEPVVPTMWQWVLYLYQLGYMVPPLRNKKGAKPP